MLVNWEEVTALTGLSTAATGLIGYFVTIVVDRQIDRRLKSHTDMVLKPLVEKLMSIELTLARHDERLIQVEQRHRDTRDVHMHGHVPAHEAGTGY